MQIEQLDITFAYLPQNATVLARCSQETPPGEEQTGELSLEIDLLFASGGQMAPRSALEGSRPPFWTPGPLEQLSRLRGCARVRS